jgi:hypothetical protein
VSKLPTVSSSIPPDLRAFLDRVREILTTSGLDRYVTAKELVKSGIAGTTPNGVITTPIDGTTVELPPAPTGLAASGALANIILTWDPIRYKGHAYTEIWASGTNDLSTAVMIGQAPGTVYVDNVGAAATKYYWIRFVNQLGNIGEFNATAGTLGTTGSDPAYLLDVLTGSITSSELSAALNTQINDNTTEITNIGNLYMVKMNNSGFLSGFGLMSTLADGGVATSDFFVNVDRFAVTTPVTSVPLWQAATAYVANQAVRISGTTNKILICKVAGTSGGSAPSIAGAVGSLVTNGSVTWQVASSVPFAVLTSSITLNGNTLPPGVYIDGASIVNATINSAQVGSLTADKITTGTLGAEVIYAGTVDAANINADTLSAVSASTGSLTVSGALTMDTAGHIKAGQTDYDTGTGFFLGRHGPTASAAYKFSIGVGSPTGPNMTWNGTALNIIGGTVTSATFRTAPTTAQARVEISATTNTLIIYGPTGSTGTTPFIEAGGTGSFGATLKVRGTASQGPSIWGFNDGAPGIYGVASSGEGVYGTASGAIGVGVKGEGTASSGTTNYGVLGTSTRAECVRGQASVRGGSNHGVRGINTNGSADGVSTAGLIGAANGYNFYADGGSTLDYGPFTGVHDALADLGDTFEIGDIVVDQQIIVHCSISSTISLAKTSTTPNQKAAIGVVSMLPRPLSEVKPKAYCKDFEEDPETHAIEQVMIPQYDTDCQVYNIIAVNALGEGQINVCGEGGDIQAGDLIVTSSTPGKGMKQADDIVRAITVAKARESVTFSSPTEVKQIACIYLCG